MPFARPLPLPDSAALSRLELGQFDTGSAPKPVPPSWSQIHLPADQYLHRGAPTEWWWHIGTLKTEDGRIFGFEINAASFQDRGIGFTQIMLTDVANKKHYQRTTWFVPPQGFDPQGWAEHDPTKDWHVAMGSAGNCLSVIDVTAQGENYSALSVVEITGGGGSQGAAYPVIENGQVKQILLVNPGRGYTSAPVIKITDLSGTGSGAKAQAVHSYVTMDAAWGDPTQNMAVTALLNDVKTGTGVHFDLMMSQQGAPFLVLGAGILPLKLPGQGTHLQTNNYYYSLTRLQTKGTITLNGESFAVSGMTWMDHEYGLFGSAAKPVRWILQDMQLDNGWCISNFSFPPSEGGLDEGQATKGYATLQAPDGAIYVALNTTTTLLNKWQSPDSGITYFLELKVEIADFEACITVTSLVAAQELYQTTGSVYEGVAGAVGTFQGQKVTGTAWNEQAMPQPQ